MPAPRSAFLPGTKVAYAKNQSINFTKTAFAAARGTGSRLPLRSPGRPPTSDSWLERKYRDEVRAVEAGHAACSLARPRRERSVSPPCAGERVRLGRSLRRNSAAICRPGSRRRVCLLWEAACIHFPGAPCAPLSVFSRRDAVRSPHRLPRRRSPRRLRPGLPRRRRRLRRFRLRPPPMP